MTIRIFAVIVLYKKTAVQSTSYQSLLEASNHISKTDLDLSILLYDNSPSTESFGDLPSNVMYLADKNNRGLASAYNQALEIAIAKNYEWLLTLDQDTKLPVECLSSLQSIISKIENRSDVGAIVPQIFACDKAISPYYFAFGVWPRQFPLQLSGVSKQAAYAFNSGSLLRVTALQEIGGYSPWFWLDNSDLALYKKLSKFGKSVYLARTVTVEHDFSMFNMSENISNDRYRMMLLSESAFWDMEMSTLAGFERTARLMGRFIKHLWRRDRIGLTRLTARAILCRLFLSRRRRIEMWRRATRDKLGSVVEVL